MLDIERTNDHSMQELLDLLQGKKVYVQTHNFPDPDAIGAGFGMQQFLIRCGIDAKLCFHGKIDRLNTKKMVDSLGIEIFSKDELTDMGENDPIICVDSQKNNGNILDLVGDEVACVDHHPTVVPVDYFYKDVRTVGSCCTLIAKYFEDFDIEPDRMTATALMYGLQMDTSGFTRGVTEEDVHAFVFLHPLADHGILSMLEQNQMEFQDLQAYGAAISSIQVYEKIGVACIPFPCQDALIAITCDFILSLEEVDVAVVYSKRQDGYKFSVRAEGFVTRIDCGKMIAGAKKYFLQAFVDRDTVPYEGFSAPPREKMEEYLAIARKYVPEAALRGID